MPNTINRVTPGRASMLSLVSAASAHQPRGTAVSLNARAVQAVQGAVRKFAPAAVQDHGVVRYAAHHILQIERADGVARFYLLPDTADVRSLDVSRLVGSTVNVEADEEYRVTKIRLAETHRNLRAV